MLKKIIPLAAVILLSACAHGMSGTCTKCAEGQCKCAHASGDCAGHEKCAHCAEKAKAENEAMGSDCPKCAEAKRYYEAKRYNN